jgi:hypothetical protein
MFNQVKSFFHTNSRVCIKLENLNYGFGKKLTNRHKFIFIDNKVNNIYDTVYILNRKIDTLQRKLDTLENSIKEKNNSDNGNCISDIKIYKNLKNKKDEDIDHFLIHANSGLG